MAVPAFGTASAGESDGEAAFPATYPASISAGDVLKLHMGSNSVDETVVTPAGWTLQKGPEDVGVVGRHWIFEKVAAGGETGSFVVTWSGIGKMSGRMYRFTGGSGTNTATTAGAGTSASIGDEGVTTDADDQLAVNFVFVPRGQFTLAAFTGQTGGTWTEAIAEFQDGAGTDGNTLQLQRASMATVGTINGGSTALSPSTEWGVIGFAIRSTGADELVLNGDFEVDLTGWTGAAPPTISRSTSVSHGGVASMFIDTTASDQTAEYDLIDSIAPDTSYTLGAWIYVVTDGDVKIGWNEYTVGDAYIQTQDESLADVLNSTWTYIQITGVTSLTTAKMRPHVGTATVPIDLYVDDVVLTGTVAPPAPSGAHHLLTMGVG